jgi:hypothetical protein
VNWQKERREYTKARWLAPVLDTGTVEIYFLISIFQFRFSSFQFLFLEFDEGDGFPASLLRLERVSLYQRMRGEKL